MLGIVVDHSYASVTRWSMAARSGVVHPEAPPAQEQARPNPGTGDRSPKQRVGWAGTLVGLVVAGIALVPIGLYLSQNVPLPVQASPHTPSWFRTAALHLGHKQVLLVLPDNIGVESPLIWQVETARGMPRPTKSDERRRPHPGRRDSPYSRTRPSLPLALLHTVRPISRSHPARLPPSEPRCTSGGHHGGDP